MEISIRHFALIEEARVVFTEGFNVLTGETGAGKSIILDALGLMIGGRASSEMVRTGTDRAIIEALFTVDSDETQAVRWLHEAGIAPEDGHVIISREVTATGKSTARINGRLVTVQALRQLGPMLVHLHGQHEHQALLDPAEHLKMLDAYGGKDIASLRSLVAERYREVSECRRLLKEARKLEQERLQRVDVVRLQLEELQTAKLRVGEEERLNEERKKLASAEKLYESMSAVHQLLYDGSERAPAAIDQIHRVIVELDGVIRYDQQLSNIAELCRSAVYQLEEAVVQARDYRDSIEFNPQKLSSIEDRLAHMARLRKKYGESIEQLIDRQERLEEEWSLLENFEEHVAEQERKSAEAIRRLADASGQLSASRQRVARRLETSMLEQLAYLSMPRTQFAAQIRQTPDDRGIPMGDEIIAVSETGIDEVEFLFSSNVGEPLRPLAKVASGGELSRTMLAVKSIFADVDDVDTMIFDEVDSGISGRAAQAVAQRLANLGLQRQVICVTHLPQVACMATTHFLIEKTSDDERTTTMVHALDYPERVEELARMLSGAELTDTTRQHAREMLSMAVDSSVG